MADKKDWHVPMTPVRNADCTAAGASLPARPAGARVAELRRLALGGHYASPAMMDLVARRLLASGEL